MGIIKLIIIVFFVWAGFWLLKKFRKPVDHIEQKSSTNKMLACSICKVHVPENEAVIQDDKVFCSKQCLR